MQIAVVGASQPRPESLALAEAVGRELARRGIVLVCGGGTGVMEAACRGAKSAGGTTVGILSGDDPSDANAYVDIVICTGMGYGRNSLVVKSGRAVIAIDGAYGTLTEIGHALGEKIPVIGLNTWSLVKEGAEDKGIERATDPVDAVERAVQAARRREAAPT